MQLLKPIISIALLLSLTACNGYQKILKSNDTELKYEKALEFYNNQDYYKAIQLLDNLRAQTRGTDKAEDVYYYYAYAHYKNEEYILASYYFKNFVKSFPKSDKKEKSLYMAAYCKYMQAPPYYLDQSTTRAAINELDLFTEVYPNSKLVEEANKHISELKKRIEKKEYHKATMYHKMENWEAAAYSLKVFLNRYPVSKYRENALFKILDARYNYAQNSIKAKKPERYNEVLDAYDNLISEYPKSEFRAKADKIKNKSKAVLEDLKLSNIDQ